MIFKYRYVDFGIKFTKGEGIRPAENRTVDPATLYSNEIAVDVGAECWGYENCTLLVFDHHFVRPGQYASATLAVLDHAEPIRAAVASQELVWLVTHRDPDFDAFCSMYAARVLLEEDTPPQAWQELNPFNPDLSGFPKEHRWIALLGAYASLVDNCRRVSCRKERALHSILYAALQRGRDYLGEDSGATEFFDQARHAMSESKLNPLFDSVLEGNAVFGPELAMLDREVLAYERDLRRARKTLVHLCEFGADDSFTHFYDRVKMLPLERRAHGSGGKRSQTDGIYIRDPECLLFKEWARLDTDNSSLGNGFVFSAVAYSAERPLAEVNSTNYFFSVDPERAEGRHLYDVWENLEREEMWALEKRPALIKSLQDAETKAHEYGGTIARRGFEARAGDRKYLFGDPWFDGNNYNCTIVATPNRGTYIAPPGHTADLSDDQVTRIVVRCLEYSLYSGPVVVRDLSLSVNAEDAMPREAGMGETLEQIGPTPRGFFRLAAVPLEEYVDLKSGSVVPQIAASLWRVLNPAMGGRLPDGFLDHHVFWREGWVAVRTGNALGVAYKESAKEQASEMQLLSRRLTQFVGEANQFIYASPQSGTAELLDRGERLIRKGAQLTYEAALPDNQVLQLFLEASRLNEVLRIMRDELTVEAAGVQRGAIVDGTRQMVKLQGKVEVLELVIVSFYSTELMKTLTDYLGLTHAYSLKVSFAGVVAITAVVAFVMHRSGSLLRIFAALLAVWLLALAGLTWVPKAFPRWLEKPPQAEGSGKAAASKP